MNKFLIITILGFIFFASCSTTDVKSVPKLTAKVKTSKGVIRIELYGEKTPLTVASFVNLARRGYYDGLNFHRVISNFMIQGGCPLGTGTGNPGYKFEDEFPIKEGMPNKNKELLYTHSGAGILSMANSGPGTNGSQFFITHNSTHHLNGKHTVFGKVYKGQDVVDKIEKGDKIIYIKINGKTPKEMKNLQPRVDAWNKILDSRYKHLKPAINL